MCQAETGGRAEEGQLIEEMLQVTLAGSLRSFAPPRRSRGGAAVSAWTGKKRD